MNPPTEQQLADIEGRVAIRLAALTQWLDRHSPCSGQDAVENAEGVLTEDVPALLATVRRLQAELDAARALAADAVQYRVHLPDSGGTTLLVRRQDGAHGAGWAVSVPGYGGGRAWTAEGWQESISALSVDRLFCWPDAATAVAEARQALAAPAV